MSDISVFVVDDHPMVREGMAAMLATEKGVSLAGTAESVPAALARIGQMKEGPDVVVSDVRMPEMDGFELMFRLQQVRPACRVILMAGMPLKMEEARAKELGAGGYLPKSVGQARIVAAIRAVAASPRAFESDRYETALTLLSPRERDVLLYKSQGKTQEEIAIILGIGFETVKAYVKLILRKLDRTSMIAAVSRAYELGIIKP